MKRITQFLAVVLLLLTSFGAKAQSYYGDYNDFYTELAPYGQWISDPQYGYVWAPDAGPDFQPYYTNGYWTQTEYGNTWVSNYRWGWAPFHYGRWTYDPFYGWVWIPGRTWGPAWVTWRGGGGYYGWAPLGPGINININIGSWNPPSAWWCFIPANHLYTPGYYHQHPWQHGRYGGGVTYSNTTVINQTTIINNTYNNYVVGPRPSDYQRTTGQRVEVRQVNNSARPGAARVANNTVQIYRPEIREARRNARPQNAIRPERSMGNNVAADSRIQNTRSAFEQGRREQQTATAPRVNRNEVRQNGNVRQAQTPVERSNSIRPEQPANNRAPEMRNNNVRQVQPARTQPGVQRQPAMQQPVERTPNRPEIQRQQEVRPNVPVRQQPARQPEPVQRNNWNAVPREQRQPAPAVRPQPTPRTQPIQRAAPVQHSRPAPQREMNAPASRPERQMSTPDGGGIRRH